MSQLQGCLRVFTNVVRLFLVVVSIHRINESHVGVNRLCARVMEGKAHNLVPESMTKVHCEMLTLCYT